MADNVAYAYQDTPEGFLSSPQVCKEVGISYRQLEYWWQNGWIPDQPVSVGSGRRRLWTPEQLDRVREIADAFDEAVAVLARVGIRNGDKVVRSARGRGSLEGWVRESKS